MPLLGGASASSGIVVALLGALFLPLLLYAGNFPTPTAAAMILTCGPFG